MTMRDVIWMRAVPQIARWHFLRTLVLVAAALCASSTAALAQQKSVRPGINDSFKDADPSRFVERWEAEGREVYDQREKILEFIDIQPGQVIADIGAGTGLFTRLFSEKVGGDGRVFAVDITTNFVNAIVLQARRDKINNIIGVICSDDSCELPANSVDVVYICDTYHHFEFPQKTMQSIQQAMREDAKLIVIDFERIEGESSAWILGHVRAGKETVLKEIESAGFELVKQKQGILSDNYILEFTKK